MKAVQERFDEKVSKATGQGPYGDCWLWIGSTREKGHGQFRLGGTMVAAHRFAYEVANGPIEAGLFVCHRCDTPRCVNPAHLFQGTNKDNAYDMIRKGRAAFQKRTHCKNGHALTDDNLVKKGNSSRMCRTCYGPKRKGVQSV